MNCERESYCNNFNLTLIVRYTLKYVYECNYYLLILHINSLPAMAFMSEMRFQNNTETPLRWTLEIRRLLNKKILLSFIYKNSNSFDFIVKINVKNILNV